MPEDEQPQVPPVKFVQPPPGLDQAVADAELDDAEHEGGAHTGRPSAQTGDVEHF